MIGCAIGTLAIALVGVLANRFLIIPFYAKVMPIGAILEMCAAVNPAIDSLNAYYWFAVFPFNLFKGALLSVITVLCYKKLSLALKRGRAQEDLHENS
jgi:riboflavin transporter FmnP